MSLSGTPSHQSASADRTAVSRETTHVVMMSGGLGSWAAARRVIQRYGKDSVVLLFADTRAEHDDLYRFLADASAQLGVPITTVADGRNPWEVFRDERMIGNTRLSVCSRALKQVPCRKWLQANTDPERSIVHVGIDWTESHRLPAIGRGWAPWPTSAPLCDPPYIDKDALVAELESAGLRPPALYGMGFPHNNCGGACVRAGQAQWRLLLESDPQRFAYEEAQEAGIREYLGKDVAILRDRRGGVTKPLPLTVLRQRAQPDSPTPIDSDDWGGCGCFTGEVAQ